MTNKSKVYGLRIPARGVLVLEKAIRDSGHSQSEFFRIAIEAACSSGGIEAAAYQAGRSRGHDDAGHLIAKFAEELAATGKRMEENDSVETVAAPIRKKHK